jgi:hypothetical protein
VERNKNLPIAGLLAAAAILIVAGIVAVRIVLERSARSQAAATFADATAQADEAAALRAAQPIDPAMVGYHEAVTFSLALREPRALAVDADQIYVGGDRTVAHYSGDGKKLAEITIEGEPQCLAVGAADHIYPGRLYVGMEDHVEVHDPQGKRLAVWESRGPEAVFTSIAAIDREVWVADAGNRLVWRFDAAGKLLGPVGKPDPSQRPPGFQITSRYFDLAAGSDGLVYVVNPRLLHVEGFTRKGEYETAWGKGSSSVADFFGCCNPAQLAVLPDGSFVTAEKGMARVKIYSADGRFQTVVAGPAQLSDTPADLAADCRGRVLVLDARAAKVRIFEKNSTNMGEQK